MLIKFFTVCKLLLLEKVIYLSFQFSSTKFDLTTTLQKKKSGDNNNEKPPTNNMQIYFTYILSAFWLYNWFYQFLWRFCCNKELILATSLGRLGTDEVLTMKQPFKDGNREVKKAIPKELIGALRRGEGKI